MPTPTQSNQPDYSQSIDACAAHYGEDASAVRDYMLAGQARAHDLPNRGPIRFTEGGVLHPNIVAAYSEHGFYVLEGVIGDREMADIIADMEDVRSRFPIQPDAELDASGRPALGTDCKAGGLMWSKPLSDPLGGTELANGRHQVKLQDLKVANDAPAAAPFILLGSLQFSEAALRIYGHPQLLRVAAAINGEDFAPFNEVLFIKDAGLGAAVSWHQDGDTHWNADNFDEGIHGFNFMAQVYGSTPVNGVWVVPGTHKQGKINITEMVAESGSERLKDAIPIVCAPGDVVICNRQLVHGSFANAGFEPRLTINFGFHRRTSVLDVEGAGIHSAVTVYDSGFIKERSRVIGLAIDARQQHYPDEIPYIYKPHTDAGEEHVWDKKAKESLRDYNAKDLSI